MLFWINLQLHIYFLQLIQYKYENLDLLYIFFITLSIYIFIT